MSLLCPTLSPGNGNDNSTLFTGSGERRKLIHLTEEWWRMLDNSIIILIAVIPNHFSNNQGASGLTQNYLFRFNFTRPSTPW